MNEYYLIVEIDYVDFYNMKRDKVKIKRVFDKPQETLEKALQLCIHDFYAKTDGCDIDTITVIANALLA